MLVSKKTWCFFCSRGELERSVMYAERNQNGRLIGRFEDKCYSCGAKKFTDLATGYLYYEKPTVETLILRD